MSYREIFESNNNDLQTILNKVNELPEVSSGGNVEQATPEISISSGGLITATAGDKSATKQLTVQAAKTITPSTSSQTAVAKDVYTTGAVTVAAIPSSYVKPTATKSATTYTPTTTNQTIASGTYLTGAQTIKGDSNLVAGNIKSGVSIFGVNGSYIGNSSGGSLTPSNPSASTKAVNFRDYDDTILYSYTKDEALALTTLPALPSQQGLICQGWNWSLEDMKSYVTDYGKLDIGATYITDDGKTRIYITLQEGRTSPMLGCCPNGTVTVDWGDGSTSTLTGTSTSTVKWTSNHNYASSGDYVITLSVSGSMGFYGSSSSNQYSGILRHSSSSNSINYVYRNAVQKIEIGNGVTSIDSSAFRYCYSLASITIPDGVTSIDSSAFRYCYSLASITIPDGVTSIGSSAFQDCYSLVNIIIPDGVTSIGSGAFQNCYSLAKIRFNPTTPPTVSNSNAHKDIPTDCVISVPTGALSAYTSATNYPSSSTYTYIEED